jgi:putative tail protein
VAEEALLGALVLGEAVLGAEEADDGNLTLNAASIAANWGTQPATLVAGDITLAANAIAANWQPVSAFLAVVLDANAIAANWQPVAATLLAGDVEVAANAISAAWGVFAATLLIDDADVTLQANAISAGWAPQPATILPGDVTLLANVLSTYAVQPATLVMGGVTVLAGAAIDAAWAVRSASLLVEPPPCNLAVAPITVGCVLEKVARRCGFTSARYDFDPAEVQVITGYVIAQRQAGAAAVADLLRAYDTFLYEADGKLKAGVYGGASQGTIDAGELGAHFWGEAVGPTIEVQRLDDLELPSGGDITYFDVDNDYEQAQQGSERYTKSHLQERVTFSPSLMLTASVARQIIEKMVYRQWVEREQFATRLGPKFLKTTPGDVWDVPVLGMMARVRFIGMDIALFGPIAVTGVLDDIDVLTQTAPGATSPATSDIGMAEVTVLHAWSSPALRDQDASANTVGFYAAAGPSGEGDWPGCQLYWSRDGGATYDVLDTIEDPSEFGVATTTIPAPPDTVGTAVWDTISTVDVTMTNGAPVASTDTEVMNGANRAMLGDELIAFVNVQALGGDNYRLSRLLRGQRGTDAYWDTHDDGDRFVILELGGAAIRVEVGAGLLNATIKLKAVTFGTDLAVAPAVDLEITGDELRPYSGSDLRGERDLSNNLDVTWMRRTRYGGEWADFMEAPLGEATEAYEAEAWDVGFTTLKRTFTGLTDESFTYSAADQTTDGFTPGDPVGIAVYQVGAIGRGFVLQGVL